MITITQKRTPVVYPYILHNHILNHVQVIKYLGVGIATCTTSYARLPEKEHYHCQPQKNGRPINWLYGHSWTTVVLYGTPTQRHWKTSWKLYNREQPDLQGPCLKWTILAERRKAASLVVFYKFLICLVAVDMSPSLTTKTQSTTRVENYHGYHIPGSSKEYHCMAFFQRFLSKKP